MTKQWRIVGMLLAAAAIVCIGICIFQEGQNKALLSLGLLCNALAFVIYCIAMRKKKVANGERKKAAKGGAA